MGLRPYRPKPADMQAKRIASAAPSHSHCPGWPHISRQGTCLCQGSCCIGRDGCKCPDCNHQTHPRRELEMAEL